MAIADQLRSTFERFKSELNDTLESQAWYQELRSKWEEVDPQTRLYVQAGSFAAGVLLLVGTSLGFVLHVYGLKHEISEKSDLLQMVRSAQDELERMRTQTSGSGSETIQWAPLIEAQATQAGLDKSQVNVSPEKPIAKSNPSNESLIEIELKKLNLKRLIRFAVALETHPQPIRERTLQIDAKDPEGWLSGKMSVSVFIPGGAK